MAIAWYFVHYFSHRMWLNHPNYTIQKASHLIFSIASTPPPHLARPAGPPGRPGRRCAGRRDLGDAKIIWTIGMTRMVLHLRGMGF
jgi:hypothetical protein